MKTAAIISVGAEIMYGKIDDTNSTFISKWLIGHGIKVKFRLSTDDIINDIVQAIKHVSSCDLIILTGGLGPTTDDITREALAKFLKKKLVFQKNEYKKIENFFKKMNRPSPVSNKKQAELIDGGKFLPNDAGTAPGIFYQKGNKIFVLLPGPPRENQPMLKNQLLPKLKKKGFVKGNFYVKIYRIYNVGESAIADLFRPFKEDIEIGFYPVNGGWCEIHLSKYIPKKEQIKKLAQIIKKAEKILKDAGLFFTEDVDISKLVLEALEQKKLTLSFAESITGGNLSGEFVKNPGASKIFAGGIVAYSNETKKKVLGVKKETLDRYGAVSDAVVKEMALGLKKITGTDIAISVSGIAGPDGGTKEKPIGTVCFGFAFGNNIYTKKELFIPPRSRIMVRAINMVFVEILKTL
jgi:nicotinamide-nucleotide amidase